MKLSQMIEERDRIQVLAQRIFTEKNKEYAAKGDALDNFHKAAAQYKVHPQLVLGIFMDKHLASIRSHIASRAAGEVPGSTEPFENRIADAINYLLFLWALEVDHRNKVDEAWAQVGIESNLTNVGAEDV